MAVESYITECTNHAGRVIELVGIFAQWSSNSPSSRSSELVPLPYRQSRIFSEKRIGFQISTGVVTKLLLPGTRPYLCSTYPPPPPAILNEVLLSFLQFAFMLCSSVRQLSGRSRRRLGACCLLDALSISSSCIFAVILQLL